MEILANEDNSTICEPPHLPDVDWSLPQHRRSVAACLVKATYILAKSNEESDALARPWYERLHFKLIRKLVHGSADSIFGAIYESIASRAQDKRRGNAPKYVIAFRGTQLMKDTWLNDVQLDLRIATNLHNNSSRCKTAVKSAVDLVADAGAENVWIAGHSLGAAIGTHVGKTLALQGSYVMTFLFNPPFVTMPVHLLKSKKLNQSFHIVRDSLLWTMAAVMGCCRRRPEPSQAFTRLSSWVPNIFVNKADSICAAYIAYFEHRETMGKIFKDSVWKLGTQKSFDILSSRSESNSLDLLPSANLTENRTKGASWDVLGLEGHGINQWLDPCQDMPSKKYLYPKPS